MRLIDADELYNAISDNFYDLGDSVVSLEDVLEMIEEFAKDAVNIVRRGFKHCPNCGAKMGDT